MPEALDGVRVDRAVALLTDRSRSAVVDLVAGGGVHVDGRVVRRGSTALRAGQRLVIEEGEDPRSERPVPDPTVAFDVVHADDQVIVVDKPAGLVVHPGAGHRTGTLVHGLLARFPDLADLADRPGGDPDRPGIVHRLDRGTSGLLAVARTPSAADALTAQLAGRRMRRVYLALVEGRVEAPRGVVDAPVGRSSRQPTRMAVTQRGRPARTTYEVERRLARGPSTLLRLRLETGRTHQIRVHLAAIGHPVAGDDTYGRRAAGANGLPAGRPFLHATELGFEHPATGEPRQFSSPLPADLVEELGRREREEGPAS